MADKGIFIPVTINLSVLDIREDSIYKLLGYTKKAEEEFISDTITKNIKKGQQMLSPSGGYIVDQIIDLDITSGMVRLANAELHVKRIIASQLKKATSLAIFVGTIGSAVEKFSEQLFLEGDPFEGYIMNLVGSVAAEAVAQNIHDRIQEDMNNTGLSITNRFSPGYCDWDVAEQFKLFKYLPEKDCKVNLTSSALMEPVKSVSGIIGIGEEVAIKNYPCQRCTRENCIYKNSAN